ncbi:MAG: WecB/TagA/CpsF family glycosyltransferase [Anaerolineae bacterium]|nr:WecB/TagA/CpsF family glycosyltransferase [Anaerolineae bacterium]
MSGEARRILVVQLADIGDLVLSTPALAALRAAHPTDHLALLTTRHAAPILEGAGLVDELLLFDKHAFDRLSALARPRNLAAAVRLTARLRRRRYDAIVFLHHFSTRFGALKFAALAWSAASPRRLGLENGRGFFLTERIPDEGFGAKHQAQYWLDLMGLLGADPAPRPARIGVPDAAHLLPRSARPRIALHAGSGGYSPARRWDPVRFAEVADRLIEQRDAEIVLVGGKGDDSAAVRAAMRHAPLDLTGGTTLSELSAVLGGCDLFIGADSGVMHIAAAAGAPVLAIFGPSNAAAWSPWTPGGRSAVVRSAPACSPCSYVGVGVGAREGCAARTCMRLVTVDQVTLAAVRLLDSAESLTPPGHPPTAQRAGDTLRMLGLPVSVVTYQAWMAQIARWMEEDRKPEDHPRHVCTINPEMIMIAQRDPVFRVVLERADLTVPDGVGLLLAARWKGRRLPERVTGSDGVPMIAAEAAAKGWRLFFLGAAPGIADQAAAALLRDHPALQIAGIFSGSPAPDEEDALVERINASGTDILLVAYGAPEQDKWIARNSPRLRVRMAMGVGGTFDFIAGVVPRAPAFMRRAGLEWLYRLYLQPWRIKRMMRLPRFALAVLLEGREHA